MTRRGIYQLELAAASAVLGGVVLVSLLAVMGLQNARHPSDWTLNGGGVASIARPAVSNETVHYIGLGAGGCATATCHGGVRTPDGQGRTQADEWKTSAFVFLQQDPHAQAFNVLFEERSREMIRRLSRDGGLPPEDLSDVNWYVGQLQEKCVSCHATPLPEGTPVTPEAGLNHYALGVTCEACHGPASRWGDEHLSKSWNTTQSSSGFNQLEDLSVAATTCAKCHIGDGSQVDGKSNREVTHDLIAAGHPRLDFDFAAWYASMPKHWNRKREEREAFAVDCWLNGQVEALRARSSSIDAVFQFYKDDSSGVERISAKASRLAVEPDFARFDCFACHRTLRFPPGPSSAPIESRATIPFGASWKLFGRIQPDSVTEFNEAFSSLWENAVPESIDEFPKAFDKESLRLETTLPPAQFAERILAEAGSIAYFDEIVSFYYAVDAVNRDADFAAKATTDLEPVANDLDERLQTLKGAMEAYVTSSDQVSRYVSPRGFGVRKSEGQESTAHARAVQTALAEVQSALREIAQQWPKMK